MNFHQLEDRQLLATVTVTNATDLTNANTSSITALIANDGGDGISLREAIAATNNTTGEDTITFDGNVFTGGFDSLIRLTQGELEITDTLTIDASAATNVTITGDANGDDVTVAGTFITDVTASFGETAGAADDLLDDNSRVLNSESSSLSFTSLTLTSLTVTGGRTTGFGGAYVDGGPNNDNGNGGGIYVRYGDVILTDSIVSGNSIIGEGANGGGVAGGSVLNSGFSFDSGDVVLINSTVSGNSTTSNGGGNLLAAPRGEGGGLSAPGDVILIGSTVSDNTASGRGGGISALGDATIVDSTLNGNSTTEFGASGGGLSTGNGTVILTNSTVSGNSTTGIIVGEDFIFFGMMFEGTTSGTQGGGIFTEGGNVTLTNSTVSGNAASGRGGGLFQQNRVYFGDGNPSLSIENSIISGNTDGGYSGPGPDLVPAITSSLTVNHSLIGDTAGSLITAATGTGNILDQPALLGPLADNGGPTLTHALLTGSPAINAGSNSLAVDSNGLALASDQRGDPFDRIFGSNVDIGAFEVQSTIATAPTVVSTTIDEGGVLARPDLLNTLTIVFDASVSVSAGDLSLFNDSTGGSAVDLSEIGFNFDSSTNTAVWDFTALAAPLDAAFYTYQLDANSITFGGLSLDGNGDGTAGGDFVAEHYVAIPGDANLDGIVNVLGDAFAFAGNLTSTTNLAWADGNFNGDGVVNVFGDGFPLIENLGRDVRPPLGLVTASSTGPVAANLALTSTSDPDDQDNATDAARLTSPSQPPSLALAGDYELRDSVFGSDF